MAKRTVMFLFGAGASFGNEPTGHPTPPLGKDLFPELRKNPSSFIHQLSEPVVDAFGKTGEAFEAGMMALWQLDPTLAAKLHREIALYLVKFSPSTDSLYKQIIELTLPNRERIIYSTLNYDMLIERSLNASGLSYGATTDPAIENPVLKIHGSIHFLPDTGGLQLSGGTIGHLPDGTVGSFFEGDLKLTDWRGLEEWIHRQDKFNSFLAPALSLYMPGKISPVLSRQIDHIRQYWVEATRSVKSIVIIGIAPHFADVHIWDHLAESPARIFYVGSESTRGVFDEWAEIRRSKGRNDRFIPGRFKDFIIDFESYRNEIF